MRSVLFIIFTVVLVHGQVGQATTATTKKKAKSVRPATYSRMGLSMGLWQESIEAKKAGVRTKIEMQSHGLRLHYNYNIPYTRSNWRQVYGGELGYGYIKGKGALTTIADELEKQPWISLTFSYGWLYRTTPVSDVGVAVPLTYRMISWDLESGSGLKMDRENSFSAGFSLLYMNRFSEKSAINISLTHHYMWDTTIWAMGWEYKL